MGPPRVGKKMMNEVREDKQGGTKVRGKKKGSALYMFWNGAIWGCRSRAGRRRSGGPDGVAFTKFLRAMSLTDCAFGLI